MSRWTGLGILLLIQAALCFAEQKNEPGKQKLSSPYLLSPQEFKRSSTALRLPPVVIKKPSKDSLEEGLTFGALLDAVEDASAVTARDKSGEVYTFRMGQLMVDGLTFLSGPIATIRIAFEEGIQVLIAPNSQVSISHEQDHHSGPYIPTLFLKTGEIRVLVEHKTSAENKSEPQKEVEEEKLNLPKTSSLYRFFVRTPTAVFAARGTDYVVFVESTGSEMHTLSGIVDAAKNFSDLRKGTGASVAVGQMIRTHLATFENPIPFEAGLFLKEFHERYPKMEAQWKDASKRLRSGRIQDAFKVFREGQIRIQKKLEEQFGSSQQLKKR